MGDAIKQRVGALKTRGERLERPPFPKRIMVEISNYCNHSCQFCAYRKSSRERGMIDPAFFRRIIREALALGAKEIGLHTGAEPFASPHLEEFVAECKQAGFPYVYFTTNASLANGERLRKVMDAGLDSLKFSVNAGDRETYLRIHGKDHFQRVLDNARFVHDYRKQTGSAMYFSISFVECPDNAASKKALFETFSPYVDEIVTCQAVNPSGQMPELPPRDKNTCNLPFIATHVTFEGYLRACCNDHHNFTAVADLNRVSLEEAWNCQAYVDLRRRFASGDLEGTLCHNCLRGRYDVVRPLNEDLCPYGMV